MSERTKAGKIQKETLTPTEKLKSIVKNKLIKSGLTPDSNPQNKSLLDSSQGSIDQAQYFTEPFKSGASAPNIFHHQTFKRKFIGFDFQLQNAASYQLHDILAKKIKKNIIKRKNESLAKVLYMDDNEEEFYTQSAERLKEIDEKQKNRIARSIENQAVRNSFTKKNEDKNDFYLQFKHLDRVAQYQEYFDFHKSHFDVIIFLRKFSYRILKSYSDKYVTPRTLGQFKNQLKKTTAQSIDQKKFFFEIINFSTSTIIPRRESIFSQNRLNKKFKETIGKKDALNFDNYLLGDTYTSVISEALSSEELQPIQTLSMANNRLTHKGIKALMSKAQQKLKKLDFSHNNVDTNGCINLESYLKNDTAVQLFLDIQQSRVQDLIIENAKVTDQGAKYLFQALQKQDYIKKLSLSKNQLGNLACIYLGAFIQKNPTLEELYLHWNCIRSQGGAELFRQLSKNDTLKVLDLSFNSMGNQDVDAGQKEEIKSELLRRKKEQVQNYKKESSKEISKYMQNSSLLHLDISYNNFSLEDMIALQTALFNNQTLVGIHLEGNSGAYIDSNGFVAFKNEKKMLLEEAIAQKRLIKGVEVLFFNSSINRQQEKMNFRIVHSIRQIIAGFVRVGMKQYFFGTYNKARRIRYGFILTLNNFGLIQWKKMIMGKFNE